jgi:hypothetical protein
MRWNERDAEKLFSGLFTFQKITVTKGVQSSRSVGLSDVKYRCLALL